MHVHVMGAAIVPVHTDYRPGSNTNMYLIVVIF